MPSLREEIALAFDSASVQNGGGSRRHTKAWRIVLAYNYTIYPVAVQSTASVGHARHSFEILNLIHHLFHTRLGQTPSRFEHHREVSNGLIEVTPGWIS